MEGAREPNGRLSRSGIPHEAADVVAIAARMKHLGIDKDQARDQKAATFIGYLNLLGSTDGLSDRQHDGAKRFLELRGAYLRAIKAPGSQVDDDHAGSGNLTEAYEEWVANTKRRYLACRGAVQEAQNMSREENLWAALDLVIIEDRALHHMVGATRLLCNALAKFFGL